MVRAGRERTRAPRAPRRAHGPSASAVARVLAAVAAIAVVAACGPAQAPAPAAPAAVVSAADCLAPQVLGRLGLTLDPSLAAQATHAPDATAGRVPGGFLAASVLVCQVGGRMRDSAGTWTAVTATSREGSAAAVASLVAALASSPASRLPSPLGTTPPGDPPAASSCDAGGDPMVLWLLDAMGRAVLSDVVADGCGFRSSQVLAALERIPVTGVVDHPVQLVAPAG